MKDAFEILFNDYRSMVGAYLHSLLKDRHLAEDLTQETFLVAKEKFADFGDDKKFGAWLRGIARNKALMHWRTSQRKPLVIDSRIVDGVDDVFDRLERNGEGDDWWEMRRRALRDCVGKLGDRMRQAIEGVYFGRKTLAEVSEANGATVAAVGQRLTRARRLIRECVEQKVKGGIDV